MVRNEDHAKWSATQLSRTWAFETMQDRGSAILNVIDHGVVVVYGVISDSKKRCLILFTAPRQVPRPAIHFQTQV